MDILKLLKGHRSIRKYTDEPLSDETVEEIIGAGLAAATSSNLQGATVIRVREPSTRAAIAEVAGGQTRVETAAAQNAVVAAESMGLGFCYIGGIRNDPQTVADLLDFARPGLTSDMSALLGRNLVRTCADSLPTAVSRLNEAHGMD